jgi:hypothetical protein
MNCNHLSHETRYDYTLICRVESIFFILIEDDMNYPFIFLFYFFINFLGVFIVGTLYVPVPGSVLICCMGGTDGEQPVREGLCGNPDGLNRY